MPRSPDEGRSYRVFGLSVRSELSLDDLTSVADERYDVSIRIVSSPEPWAERGIEADGTTLVMTVPDVARYTVTGGTDIAVEAAPNASARNVRLYLLGSAFGGLMHQRGMLPLHANAIDLGGFAVAFMGHSGAGKSTLAAWFEGRGYNILSDDVSAISQGDAPRVEPGLPRLRLWRDALEARGGAIEDYSRSFDDLDKYDVPSGRAGAAPDGPVPLARIYLLGRAEAAGIRRMGGAEATAALVANTYRGVYLKMIGGAGRHLMACAALARAVPVYAADRIWGHDRLDAEAGLLEAHALGQDRCRG